MKIMPTRCVDENWRVLHPINHAQFDFSWHPHPLDPPYIYVWGNQHWPGEKMPTVEYHVEGATERKYMDWPARVATANKLDNTCRIDPASVDYSWCARSTRPCLHLRVCYTMATQWRCCVHSTRTQQKYASM
jgi:hypothetical protein